MTNFIIHGENKSFFDWTKVMKAFRNELSHGIGHGTNDKLNESIEHPFIVTKN